MPMRTEAGPRISRPSHYQAKRDHVRDVGHDLDQSKREMDHDDGVVEGVQEDGSGRHSERNIYILFALI